MRFKKNRIGTEEIEQRRQLLFYLRADRLERTLVAQELGDGGEAGVEELMVMALPDQEIDEIPGERREIDAARLAAHEAQRKFTRAGMLESLGELRQQAQDRLRQSGAVPRHFQPAAHDVDEVDALQFRRDDFGAEKMHLDEFAEAGGDAMPVVRDDRGMRDRQAERMAEQGDHREPVGEATHRARLGKSREEAERRMQVLDGARDQRGDEEDRKKDRRNALHVRELGGRRARGGKGLRGRADRHSR